MVAPKALRRPISRVRSVTETSMMLTTPIAPRPSVTRPTAPRKRIHRIRDFADHLGAGDGVPIVERIGRFRIEIVIPGHNGADRFLRLPRVARA